MSLRWWEVIRSWSRKTPGFQSPTAKAQNSWSLDRNMWASGWAPWAKVADAGKDGRGSSESEKPVAGRSKESDRNNSLCRWRCLECLLPYLSAKIRGRELSWGSPGAGACPHYQLKQMHMFYWRKFHWVGPIGIVCMKTKHVFTTTKPMKHMKRQTNISGNWSWETTDF